MEGRRLVLLLGVTSIAYMNLCLQASAEDAYSYSVQEIRDLKLHVSKQTKALENLQEHNVEEIKTLKLLLSEQAANIENLQQHLIRTNKRADDVAPLEVVVDQLSQRLNLVSAQLQSLTATGSVYTRWGSGSCPTSAQLVYSGVIGGSSYTHTGGATNSLCVPLNPVYVTGSHLNVAPGYAGLYGTEYEVVPEATHNRKATCAVCLTPGHQTLMVPATHVCPAGWSREYSGFLMADLPLDGRTGTEYICVDGAQEGLLASEHTNYDEHVLYYTKTYCGSFPCPPFLNEQVATCVVCSR